MGQTTPDSVTLTLNMGEAALLCFKVTVKTTFILFYLKELAVDTHLKEQFLTKK